MRSTPPVKSKTLKQLTDKNESSIEVKFYRGFVSGKMVDINHYLRMIKRKYFNCLRTCIKYGTEMR